MIIKYTVHKSEQSSLRPQTGAATLSSSHPQTCRCAATFSSLNKALVQLQPKLILKVGVTDAIKHLITMNPRNRLVSAETFNNKVSLQKYVGKMVTNLDYYWASVETCVSNVNILIKLILIPQHITIYLFAINSSKIHKLVSTGNDNLYQLYQLSFKS